MRARVGVGSFTIIHLKWLLCLAMPPPHLREPMAHMSHHGPYAVPLCKKHSKVCRAFRKKYAHMYKLGEERLGTLDWLVRS